MLARASAGSGTLHCKVPESGAGILKAVQQPMSRRWFRLGVGATTAAVAAFLLARLHAWPPHEDETLALFVGSKPLDEMLDVVLQQRGGAPLHFLLVHLATLGSPSLTAVRLISVVFTIASIPAVAALLSRLGGRRVGLIATVLLAASWVTLFHGIYGRMYGLFAFASAMSFLALLRALDRRRPLDWGLWALAVLATLASHQYGAFVLASQVAYAAVVWRRGRYPLVAPLIALSAVVATAVPLWRSNLVLASRFDVDIGQSGTRLGGPYPVLEYLRSALGDFVAGWLACFVVVCVIAVVGLVTLIRERPSSALLTGLAIGVPVIGLMLTLGGSAGAPETRHLIFVLPFFALLLAVGVDHLAGLVGARAGPVLALLVVALVGVEVAWGYTTTPTLYAGEPERRERAREAASTWLAATLRRDDVLFGYDPLFLGAREDGGAVGDIVVPRADAQLAVQALTDAPKPLGHAVWVLDASEGNDIQGGLTSRLEIESRSPGRGFESRAFGPFLVIRTTAPVGSPEAYLRATVQVQQLGQELGIETASLNYRTAALALAALADGESPLAVGP